MALPAHTSDRPQRLNASVFRLFKHGSDRRMGDRIEKYATHIFDDKRFGGKDNW